MLKGPGLLIKEMLKKSNKIPLISIKMPKFLKIKDYCLFQLNIKLHE